MADYTYYDHLAEFALATAACLWADAPIEEEHKVSAKSPAYPVFRALKDTLRRQRKEQGNNLVPKGGTLVGRQWLIERAEEWDEQPEFLFPENRRGSVTPQKRRSNLEQDAKLRSQITAVISAAKKKWRVKPENLGFDEMARRLMGSQKKLHGYSQETVSQILEGRYSTMVGLGIESPYSTGNQDNSTN